MKISILVLTHNRPELFKRCIGALLKNKPKWAEILVNNDSNDIEEIAGATYYYEKNNDLSKTYQHLFDKAQGEFIYFSEDDDYVIDNFWDMVEPLTGNTVFQYLPENDIKLYYEYFIHKPDFKENFQLSQLVFKKKDLKEFPIGNDIHNDWCLYESITDVSFINKPIFTQTTDGKDNISFPEYAKTI